MAPLISSTVAILPSTLGNALVSAELTALAEGGVPPRMKSGGGSAYAAVAVATVARAVIAIAAIAAIAASDILRRVRKRTDEAFTPHTLLRSSPDRSRRTLSFDSNASGGVPFATGRYAICSRTAAYLRGDPGRLRAGAPERPRWGALGPFSGGWGVVGSPVCCVRKGRPVLTLRRPSA